MTLQFAQKAVIVRDGRVLLVRKSMEDPFNPGRWELPGGRLKDGETIDEAIRREVKEELDLVISPGRPLAMWSWKLGDGPNAPVVIAVARLCHIEESAISMNGHDVDDFIDDWAWIELQSVFELDLIPSARPPLAEALQNLQLSCH